MLSDRGRVRRSNEDTCVASPLSGVFVVCDGMGGAAGGEVASHLAAETFLTQMSLNGSSSTRVQTVRTQTKINAAVQATNRAVFQQAQRTPQLTGMGTTLVGVLLGATASRNGRAGPTRRHKADAALWLVHVGDSRCYRWRGGGLERMTLDHSLVEEQVRAGLITAAQAIESPMRNLITRAIGAQATVEPEVRRCQSLEGDLYLLASDGLTRDLADEEIAAILSRVPADVSQTTLYAACRELVKAANAKGGGDNITVMLVAPGAADEHD